jgi:hypothetical protein
MTTRQDWLVMALAHRGGQPMTPVQIQKAMFLMSMEGKRFVDARFYKFRPYNYGPFDAGVYHDLDDLVQRGLATTSPGYGWKMHAATPAGMKEAARIRRTADGRGVTYLEKAVDWVCSLSFPALVRAIYAKYPEFKANSVFTG